MNATQITGRVVFCRCIRISTRFSNTSYTCIQLNSSEYTASSSVWLGRTWYRNGRGWKTLTEPPPCFYNLLTFLLHVWYKCQQCTRSMQRTNCLSTLQYFSNNCYISYRCFGKANTTVLVWYIFFTWQLSRVTQSEWFLSSNNRSRQHPFLEVRFYPSKLEARWLSPLADLFRWREINSVLQMELTITYDIKYNY